MPPPGDWQGAEKHELDPPPPEPPPDDEEELAAAVARGSMLGTRLAAWLASHVVASPISGPPLKGHDERSHASSQTAQMIH
jgi:hypothetical protein